jgi:hypothetical protein
MQTDKEGRAVNVYDYVTADKIEEPSADNDWKVDQVFYQNDPFEVKHVVDSGDAIMLKGYSHLTGDDVTYVLTPDTEVGLWTA